MTVTMTTATALSLLFRFCLLNQVKINAITNEWLNQSCWIGLTCCVDLILCYLSYQSWWNKSWSTRHAYPNSLLLSLSLSVCILNVYNLHMSMNMSMNHRPHYVLLTKLSNFYNCIYSGSIFGMFQLSESNHPVVVYYTGVKTILLSQRHKLIVQMRF